MLFDYPTADFHTTLLEHIATYRGTGAARYLRELRPALPACGGTDDVGRWTVVRTGVAGATRCSSGCGSAGSTPHPGDPPPGPAPLRRRRARDLRLY
jgi:hypothetical protein